MFKYLFIKKTEYEKLREERISFKKEVEMLKEQLRLKRIEDDNIYHQRWLALSIAMEGKTGDYNIKGNKCPLCNLDRRLYGIPSVVLDHLISQQERIKSL